MAPARRLGDRAGSTPGVVEIAKPGPRVRPLAGPRTGASIGLEDPGIAGEMPARVLAAAIAGVKEHRCWRVWAGERPVIPDIKPALAKVGVHSRPITVLSLARTGTVMPAPCRRSPAST